MRQYAHSHRRRPTRGPVVRVAQELRGLATPAIVGAAGARPIRWMRVRRWAARGLVPMLALGGLGWLAWRAWPQITSERWHIDPAPVAVGFGLYTVTLLAAAFLWHQIVVRLAGAHPFWRGARVYAIAMLARRLPGGPWSQASRVLMYRDAGYPWGLPVSASALELGASGLAGLCLSASLLALQPGLLPAAGWIGAGVIALVSLASLYPPALNRALSIFGRVVKEDLASPSTYGPLAVAGWIANAALIWLLGGIVLYCVVVALTPNPPSLLPVVRSWVIAGTAGLASVFLPSGLGLFEFALATLLSADLPPSTAVASTLAMRVLTTAVDAFWATLAWRIGGLTRLEAADRERRTQDCSSSGRAG